MADQSSRLGKKRKKDRKGDPTREGRESMFPPSHRACRDISILFGSKGTRLYVMIISQLLSRPLVMKLGLSPPFPSERPLPLAREMGAGWAGKSGIRV